MDENERIVHERLMADNMRITEKLKLLEGKIDTLNEILEGNKSMMTRIMEILQSENDSPLDDERSGDEGKSEAADRG